MLAHSEAPRDSVYYHFPGGRAQLIDEAVALALAGDSIAGRIDAWAQSDDPVEAIDAFDDLDDARDASPLEQLVPDLESEAADADTEGQLQLFDM